MQILNNYSVLIPAASGADIVKNGNNISITGMPTINAGLIVDLGQGNMLYPLIQKIATWAVTFPATPTPAATYGIQTRQIVQFTDPAIPGVNQVQGTIHPQEVNMYTVP